MENRFSPGSTISGIFDPNLKTPDPFQFVYISHPFGAQQLTPTTPSDFYESSFEIMEFTNSPPVLSRQGSRMNFHYNLMNELPKFRPEIDPLYNRPREFYDIKTTFYPSPISNSPPDYHQHQFDQYHCSVNNLKHCENDQRFNNPKSYLQRHIISQDDVRPKTPPPLPTRMQHPAPYNCYDERTVPELKFIFETLRNVWKTPVSLGKTRENKCRKFCCQNLPHKRNGLVNSDVRARENITPTTRSNLMRRYSLPEIEIRKFGIVQELDSILRFSEQLRQNFKTKLQAQKFKKINKVKMVEKSCQTNPVIITEKFEQTLLMPVVDICKPNYNTQPIIEFSDSGPTYLDLINNRRDIRPKLIKKPETMPEKGNDIFKLNSDEYQICRDPSSELFTSSKFDRKQSVVQHSLIKDGQQKLGSRNLSETHNVRESLCERRLAFSKKLRPECSLDSDTYISELLIGNLNEEMHIANILTKVLIEQNEENLKQKPPTPMKTPKIEISTVYVSPEKINEIVGKNTSFEKSDKTFKQTLQLPDLCLLDTFEKLPPLEGKYHPLPKDSSNGEKEKVLTTTAKTDTKSNSDSRKNNSEISSISLNDTFDTPTFPKSSEESPIDSLDLEKAMKPCPKDKIISKSTTKTEIIRKPNNVAEIQPIKSLKDERTPKQKSSSYQQSNISQSEKQLILSHKKKLNRPKIIDKDIIGSLEQYTIDSRGNPNYQKPSPIIKNQRRSRHANQSSAINSRYLRVSASSTTSHHSTNQNDKLKKVTIFEAQSNIVTPDNDMGPKRFYQKTEIFDGDKKIDILEIVECLQSPFIGDHKVPGDFYTKFSKIPIPIKRCCRSFQPQSPFNPCSAPFKCCSSNIIRPHLMDNTINQVKSIQSIENSRQDDSFFRDFMLHESLDKCEHFDLKTQNKVTKFLDKTDNITRTENKDESKKIYSTEKFKESGVSDLNTIDNSAKSTNVNDGFSTGNDLYTISVPSTMTALHGSTPRRKSSSKIKFNSTKPLANSNQTTGPLHSKSKRLRNSERYEKRLLSQRKQHRQHDVINVKPARCNQPIKSSHSKKVSNKSALTFNDEKLNAWRIPSSDFYMPPKQPPPPPIIDNKNSVTDLKFSVKLSEPVKLPESSNESKLKEKCTPSSKCPTESFFSTTTICEKCRLCSCYTSTTFSDRLLYSPTLSVCSVCSQPFTPIYQTPETPAGAGCFDINCGHATLKNNFNNDDLANKNKIYFQSPSSLQRNEICSRGKDCACSTNRFPKLTTTECPPIPEKYCGFMQASSTNICKGNDQPLDRFLPSSSSFTSSLWKSARSHTAMPCINWKAVFDNKKKPEIKIEPVRLTTTSDDKRNINPIFTVTVKGPTFEKGTDLKMELCFSNSNQENITTTGNEAENETDEVSTCSAETIHEKMLPEGSKDLIHNMKAKPTTARGGTDHFEPEYNLNLSNILNQKNASNLHNSPSKNKNLSVSGNAMVPEQKPKAPTMTEKDLTGRYRK